MLVLLASALCAPAEALAQPGSETLESIRRQMEEGQGLFLAGKYQEAAATFEAGYAKYPYSAFLFNAGVCHQKSNQPQAALRAFQEYLRKDPDAPDAADVKARVLALEAGLGAEQSTTNVAPGSAASSTRAASMKSLVVVETDPAAAPLRVFRRTQDDAAPFVATESSHPGWELVAERTTPTDLTLDVGRYHVVIDKFRDFNMSETDIDVAAGHVHQFKANLSQGAFLGFLRVSSNVLGATIYLDDVANGPPWGVAPHGELVKPGAHEVRVEALGYQSVTKQVGVEAGENLELEVDLARVTHGVVRLDATVPLVSVYEGDTLLGRWQEGAPALEITLPSGPHQLLVQAPGHKDLRADVEVPQGQILPVRATMVKKYPRGTAWTTAIVAAGLIGASTYFAVESNRLEGELSAERAAGTLSSGDPRIDQGYWYSIGADAGFAAGGLVGVLSLYNFLKDPYPEPELRRGRLLEFKRPVTTVPARGVEAAR